MQNIRTALLRLAAEDPGIRGVIIPMTRQADKWNSLPKGWTDASRKKFWETLTGDNKHKVTKCIKEMSKPDKGIDNPGAFCGALADRVLGKDWRKKKKAALQPPRHLDRRAPAGHYQIWFARGDEQNPYITDAPSIQVAMRRAKETMALAGVGPVVIYDDLGNQFKTMKKANMLDNAKNLRPLKGASWSIAVSMAKLPKVLKQVLAEVRFNKRKVYVKPATSFSMYSAGDDGARGFTAVVDLDTKQYKITWGAWGGGALSQDIPSPVDDVNAPKKSLPDHLVIVQGQIGGRDPYASITCTVTTMPKIVGEGRMAAQEQTPNAVDGAAARFKDHLEVKLNEQFRLAHPSEIPPTLTLLHGNDLIRVVKADGGLKREAVAFIARATGNVYRASTWDRPHPGVIANVLDTGSWRSMRMAFDQYNVPELLGQLKKLLLEKGLDDTWDEIQKCRVPQKVNDAWMGLPKKERQRKAARLAALREYPKFSADMRALLSQVFDRHQPYVKDWQRFLRELVGDIQEWVSYWSPGMTLLDSRVTSTGYTSWTGDQIGGYGYRGNRGFDPPEYAEHDVEVAEALHVKFGTELNLRMFPREFTLRYRSLISDTKGFLQATTDLLNNSESVNMLGKLLRAALIWWVKGDPAATLDEFIDEIQEAADEATESGWSVAYSVRDFKLSRTQYKSTPRGLLVWMEGEVTLDTGDIEAPEPDFDPPDDRW